MSDTPLFDTYATSYDAALDHALTITGADKDYFCNERLCWLEKCLAAVGERPLRAIDYGCGNGSSTPLLASRFALQEIVGVDVAPKIVEQARQQHGAGNISFATLNEASFSDEFDLVYCNGVFHHIDKGQRPAVLNNIYSYLRPGGLFSLWENNPWSPAARYVMSRCEFDRDAQMLSPTETAALLRDTGFEILSTDFLFIFPGFLKALRPIEQWVRKWPLGAQYQVLARKNSR